MSGEPKAEHWFACRAMLREGHPMKGDGKCDCDRASKSPRPEVPAADPKAGERCACISRDSRNLDGDLYCARCGQRFSVPSGAPSTTDLLRWAQVAEVTAESIGDPHTPDALRGLAALARSVAAFKMGGVE